MAPGSSVPGLQGADSAIVPPGSVDPRAGIKKARANVTQGPNGLVRVLTNEDITAMQEAQAKDHEPPVNESMLSAHIRKDWERNKLHRQRVEQRLLACLRARRGVYGPTELGKLQANGGLNVIWADLTETKCRAASAWLRDIVMPTSERPWALEPTPLPELPLEIKEAIVKAAAMKAKQAMVQMYQASQAGGQPGTTMDETEFRKMAADIGAEMRDDMKTEYLARAEKAAERMEDAIEDHLDNGEYAEAMDGFVEDFVTYPAAILKGPYYRRKQELTWLPGFEVGLESKPTMFWSRVSPFDAFPAPHTTSPQQGSFIERMRFHRIQLESYIGIAGYNEEAIRNALRDYHAGHLEQWLWTEAERQRLEQDSTYEWLSPAGVIDALQYWGSVPGWKLLSWGMDEKDVPDPMKEYEVDAVLVGPYVIRAEINKHPLKRRPYGKACYDDVPGAFWGRSIPDLCAPHQKMCNAIACAMADNLSIASGPQVWVHNDRLADGSQDLDMYPWKRWQLKSDPTQGVNPGIGFFQPQSNVEELMKAYEHWEQRADDATGIPRYVYGNENVGGATQTLGGLSMLLNSAAKGLRRAVASIDIGVTEKTVEDVFVYEMLFGKDKSIKGACTVVARGAAAILIKDSAQQKRMQALQICGNPVALQVIGLKGYAELLRETIKSLELPVDKIVPSDEDIEKQMLAAQQPPPPSPDAQLNNQTKIAMHDKTVAKDLAIAQQKHHNATPALQGAVTPEQAQSPGGLPQGLQAKLQPGVPSATVRSPTAQLQANQ